MGKTENLGLHRYFEVVESNELGLAVKPGLNSMLHSMEPTCGSTRDTRDRTIAQRDWDRRAHATPVPNKDEIEKALTLAASIINTVEFHYVGSGSSYRPSPGSGDDDHLILHFTKCAKTCDQARGE